MYVYMHTCTDTFFAKDMYIHIYVYMFIYLSCFIKLPAFGVCMYQIFASTCECIYVCLHVRMFACMCVCLHGCIYICMCVPMRACVCVQK